MPELSRFYGIVIHMYYGDHSPPHFHARYGEFQAVYGLNPLFVMRGRLPSRAHNLVLEWVAENRKALDTAWRCVQGGESPSAIPPLA